MQYREVSLMVPTYKRTQRLATLLDSALSKADDVQRVRFQFCLNEKDKDTLEYLERRYWPRTDAWSVVMERTTQPNLAYYYNLLYEAGGDAGRGDDCLVSMVGDDMEFVTPGWDTSVLAAINASKGHAIVYLNDDYIAGDKLCINLFTTSELVRATGKPFMCARYHAEMIDVVWYMVGRFTGTLRYLPNVVLRHNHNTRLPQEKWDETFQRLAPIQRMTNENKENQVFATQYATHIAGRLIEQGIGKWNVL